MEDEIREKIELLYLEIGNKIENGHFKDAIEAIFDFVRLGNRYYDSKEPWKTRTASPANCAYTLYNCVQIIANLSVLLRPFLPFSSEKVMGWLGLSDQWKRQEVPCGHVLADVSILFERLDKSHAIYS